MLLEAGELGSVLITGRVLIFTLPLLAPRLGMFTEGHDAPVLKEAEALVKELAA
jgi:hypothetical protein